ncbi:hypothetical protein MUP79_10260 [Candidatus Bathyarchaeota archaeon]|nr:hypothetical protein [Candidatus Bathyarchaeota archaeon]
MDIGIALTPEELLKKLSGQGDTNNSVEAHYGFTHRQLHDHIGDMLGDLYRFECITDAIDKHFPDTNEETRLKVFAFAMAFKHMHYGVWGNK